MRRKAFGMIYAIIITILVATLGIFGLKFSAKTLNTTTNEHIGIQLDLYLNSTLELAILYVQQYGFINGENGRPRADPTAKITKNIKYGSNGEYEFTYTITPLLNNAQSNINEDIKNVATVDISGFVTNPVTKQVFRITRRQIIKP